MKKILILAALMLGSSLLAQEPRPRFERLQREMAVPEGESAHVVQEFETYHDRETGIEFICARGFYSGGVQSNYSISCFPTGRKWK